MYSQLLKIFIYKVKETSCSDVKRMNNEQEIVSRLKFIGKIKRGEKINTHHMYVQPTGIMTFVKRTFWDHDNRSNALTFIHDAITRAFELLITHNRSDKAPDKLLANNLIKDLRDATNGLDNIKITYQDDTKFCCDIDTILEFTTARLAEYTYIETSQSPELIDDDHDDDL
jgi:hypothetical protein